MFSWCACWTSSAGQTTRSVTRTATAYVTAVYEARVLGGSPVVSDGELSELGWFGTGDLAGLELSRFARALLSAAGRL
ncbi:MAG: hydrolase [Actinomycetia bacterium]|nr:hydrolase [Actinomycetes bacterium]